jgi:MFS transporter, NNP family, nitrate/nitrite transporter
MIVLALFAVMARDSGEAGGPLPLARYARALQEPDIWFFCVLYCVTFGGYVGLGSFLPLFLRDHYGLTPVNAGLLTALAAFVGSGIRPLGGYVADRIGGVRLLRWLLLAIAAVYAVASTLPPLPIMAAVLVVGMGCLGSGNGAVFQLVPLRFRAEIGLATGIVGAVGGIGGFLLPNLLGQIKMRVGSFGPGFLVLAALAGVALIAVHALVARRRDWRLSWALPVVGPEVADEIAVAGFPSPERGGLSRRDARPARRRGKSRRRYGLPLVSLPDNSSRFWCLPAGRCPYSYVRPFRALTRPANGRSVRVCCQGAFGVRGNE